MTFLIREWRRFIFYFNFVANADFFWNACEKIEPMLICGLELRRSTGVGWSFPPGVIGVVVIEGGGETNSAIVSSGASSEAENVRCRSVDETCSSRFGFLREKREKFGRSGWIFNERDPSERGNELELVNDIVAEVTLENLFLLV